MSSIFVKQGDKGLTELEVAAYESEDHFQALLAEHPQLLSYETESSEEKRQLMLIGREVLVPFDLADKKPIRVDHLFLDQDAVPTFVEVKQGGNHDLRRKIFGQMLDYTANAVKHWPPNLIRDEYYSHGEQSKQDEKIDKFLDGEEDPDDFWKRAEDNLRRGCICMLFVSDDIPHEMQTIVEFLNEQMKDADVIAIEVKRYIGKDKSMQIIAPKIIGLTEKARIIKKDTQQKSWEEALQFILNEDIKTFFLEELERGIQGSKPWLRKIYYEYTGVRRWRLQAHKRHVNVWQEMRFADDINFWQSRFKNVEIRTPDSNSRLTFSLTTKKELEIFRDSVSSASVFAFLRRGESGETAKLG